MRSLQEIYAPHNACFGCGPANRLGLRIRSFVEGDDVVAEWQPQPHHEAAAGMLNGGIIGTLLDCNGNWAGIHALMQRDQLERPPCTVTASYSVTLKEPTPTSAPIQIRSRAVALGTRSVDVEGEIVAGGQITATCQARFVVVKPSHPAYHRW